MGFIPTRFGKKQKRSRAWITSTNRIKVCSVWLSHLLTRTSAPDVSWNAPPALREVWWALGAEAEEGSWERHDLQVKIPPPPNDWWWLQRRFQCKSSSKVVCYCLAMHRNSGIFGSLSSKYWPGSTLLSFWWARITWAIQVRASSTQFKIQDGDLPVTKDKI